MKPNPRSFFKINFVRFRTTSTSPTSQPNHYTTSGSQVSDVLSIDVGSTDQVRKRLAPWIEIGSFQKGLLSHLSTSDIIRALFVLRLCSYELIVTKSLELFNMSRKFGPAGDFLLRKTFFNQFVGGDTTSRMTQVVQSMQKRGLVLMVAPVLEEDVEDEQSNMKTYDDNLSTLLNLSSMTSSLEKRKPIIQLKLSAIMPATTLEKVSRAIELRIDNGRGSQAKLVSEISNCIENPGDLKLNIDPREITQFLDGFARADKFVTNARNLQVYVLVDAEFYTCKPAISTVAMALMARYNNSGYVVGNTIQGYLKGAVQTTEEELNVITKEIGVNWYGKTVRGAYMDRERILAKKNGYPSPICDTYEATNESYNRSVFKVLENISAAKGQKSHLLVATHNEVSIRLAAQAMRQLSISPSDDRVSFGQIYGMADYLSTPLVNMGYQVYKSTPYGPIGIVMPYLARRASENRSVLQGAREERYMLWTEFKSRMQL